MKYLGLAALSCMLLSTGCAKNIGDKYQDYFENEKAVDLSDVVDVYGEYAEAEKEGREYDLSEALEGDYLSYSDCGYVVFDTAFAVQLPQYAESRQPFLARAQDFYNSCRLAFDVWSDFDLWLRSNTGSDLMADKSIIDGIRQINENCIRSKSLREDARNYKDSMILLMSKPYEEWSEEDDATGLLQSFSSAIESESYKFFDSQEAFVDSIMDLGYELRKATEGLLKTYQETDSLKRLDFMLRSLNGCSTFDEQCSLFLNWINSKEAEMDDEWIIAVAGRLMDSGKYNPALNEIWLVWRCLFQVQYCGISRDSYIPNNFYNGMRKKCYMTCLKRIEMHPDDAFAMNCAAFLGGRVNIDRMGSGFFGNNAINELAECMPGRFGDGEDEEEYVE